MKRITPRIIIIAIILILLIVFFSFKISGSASDSTDKSAYDYTHSWTKAICNETHCQDYEIYCNGEEMIRQSPITGAVISIPANWADPRNQTMQNRVCDVY